MNAIDLALEALDEVGLQKESFAAPKPPAPPKPPQPLQPSLSGRQQREIEMWHHWNNNGRQPAHLQPLVESLQPLVKKRLNIFENRERDIPPAAIRAEFQDQLVSALETYDPTRGTKLNTYISDRLMKANRFVTTYQNPARIVEPRTYMITKMRGAEDFLHQELRRPPTAMELAEHMQVPTQQVELLKKELRKAVPTGQFEADPAGFTPSKTNELLRLIPYELTPEENSVFEHVYGTGGKPQLGTGDIAKRLNMSAPKVSRIKSAIAEKMKRYGG
jgi:DNA-directed RNA polymerase specialized sigma subunit